MTGKISSIRRKMCVCIMLKTCQILCIHNVLDFHFPKKRSMMQIFWHKFVWCVFCVHLYFVCVHQFDLMSYLVIDKPKRKRITFRICTHTYTRTVCTASDWCFILHMTKFHFNVLRTCLFESFGTLVFSQRLSFSFRIQFSLSTNKKNNFQAYINIFMCKCKFPSLLLVLQRERLYLFIYFDWCWWFQAEFVVSCQITAATNTTTTKRFPTRDEKVYHRQMPNANG